MKKIDVFKLFALFLFIVINKSLQADSTSNFALDIRMSSSLNGLKSKPAFDSAKQYSFNFQEIIYYKKKHVNVGLGTGIDNSMFYITDKKAFNRIYMAPIFASIKLNSEDKKMYVFQNIGFVLPLKTSLQNITNGYYFQSGIGLGTERLKLELSYKLITMTRDKGPLFNQNLTFGICLNIIN